VVPIETNALQSVYTVSFKHGRYGTETASSSVVIGDAESVGTQILLFTTFIYPFCYYFIVYLDRPR
jgi:hypothetical protein